MRRETHGSMQFEPTATDAQPPDTVGGSAGEFLLETPASAPQKTSFVHWFDNLARDDNALLPQSKETLTNLEKLGSNMRDREDAPKHNSQIPSVYTYFGQFIDHDVTFTEVKKPAGATASWPLDDPSLAPWGDDEIFSKVDNKRASLLELDCVYGVMNGGKLPPVLHDNPDKLALGKVTKAEYGIQSQDDLNDVPRMEMTASDPRKDRAALIADARNDSHLIVSQLHVAFLRAHNAIIDREQCSFSEARAILLKHYHWLILHDFLPAIVTGDTIAKVISDPLWKSTERLPFEFAVGAYRFGHSMIRRSYYLNDNFPATSLERFFTLTALSKALYPTPGEGHATLPADKVIQWRNFLAGGKNVARRFRPEMVEPLFEILDAANIPVRNEARLAVMDLKRSYMMRIPTGQAIAEQLGISPLTKAELEGQATNPGQVELMQNTTLSTRTPLLYYVLAEAALFNNQKLGPVGGRLVAEVLIGLIRKHSPSILAGAWQPHLGPTNGKFSLADFFQLAGVLEP